VTEFALYGSEQCKNKYISRDGKYIT